MKLIEIFECSSSCVASVATNLFSPIIKRNMEIPKKKKKKKKHENNGNLV